MNKKIQDAINEQINEELYSAYIYLAMAAFFEGKNLSGMAHWMEVQAHEEVTHAMKFYKFVFERGGQVVLKALKQQKTTYSSVSAVFEETLKHEKYITGCINKLYELSVKEKDYAFSSLLKWYIDEQVEEENSAMILIEKVKLLGDKGTALYLLDKELGKRNAN